jgi:ssDNA-binding Zn-finger/Zn-ribbon topoisomerase 1
VLVQTNQKESSEPDFKIVAELIRGAKHLKSTNDKCPTDGTSLDLYSIFSMEFEGCPKCYGMWLVKNGLANGGWLVLCSRTSASRVAEIIGQVGK